MRPRWCLPVLVSVLVGLLPQVAAEPATFDLGLALPIRFSGDLAWRSEGATLLVQSPRGDLDWRLDAGRLTLVEVELWEQVHDGVAAAGSPSSGVRTLEHDLRGATLSVTGRTAGFTALAWSDDAALGGTVVRDPGAVLPPADDASWSSRPDARVFGLGHPLEVSARFSSDEGVMGRVLGRPVPFVHVVEPGRLHLQAADATHALDGAVDAYLAEARIVVRHAQGVLGLTLAERVEERAGSVYVPGDGWTGPGTHSERVLRYVQLRSSSARLDVVTAGAPAALYTEGIDVTLRGHMASSAATGDILFSDSGAVSTDGATFVTSGAVEGALVPSGSPDRARLTGSGDVAYVRTGATSSSYSMGAVAGTAAGIAALVALGAVLWKLKEAGFGLVLFSRVAKSKALDHDARNVIYEMVKSSPGLSAHEVVERLGLGWSTVTYHLSVLERTELVIAHKEGRHRRYFDRESGHYANGRKKIVSVLKNATTAKIASEVRARPGLVQRRLAEEMGLAPSSVNWHIKRLVEAGLIVKERASRAVALMPGPAWEKIETPGPAPS